MALEDTAVPTMIKTRGTSVNRRLWDLCVTNNKLRL